VTTKEECEECERLVECITRDYPDENGQCPPGFTLDKFGFYCERIRPVADCSECLAGENCEEYPPTAGVCGQWLANGDDCTPPPKCWESACISGMPAEYYGGTFRVGTYPGLPAPNGGYRGPGDPSGSFQILPTDCGAWQLSSVKFLGFLTLYIEQTIDVRCFEAKGVEVKIYRNNPPPLGQVWRTVTIDITQGDCKPQLWCCDGGGEGYFCGERVDVPGIGEMIGYAPVGICTSIQKVKDCAECGQPPRAGLDENPLP
jgi:hypothetical protein